MLKDDELVGAFTLARQEVRSFSDLTSRLSLCRTSPRKLLSPLRARLLNELRQWLEQQTATSGVLQVISRSLGDLQPVFATILENATRICDARFGVLHLKEEDAFRTVAIHNAPPDYVAAKQRDPLIHHFPSTSALGRVKETRLSDLVMRLRTATRGGERLLVCYEAGYDGFWLARSLKMEIRVLDPASLQVNRRARRVKTDRIDVLMLLRALIAVDRGDRHAAVQRLAVDPVGLRPPTPA